MSAAWPTEAGRTLNEIAAAWASAYSIRYETGKYRAVFLYDTAVELEAATPEGLGFAMSAHWSRTWSGGYAGVASAPWDAS